MVIRTVILLVKELAIGTVFQHELTRWYQVQSVHSVCGYKN